MKPPDRALARLHTLVAQYDLPAGAAEQLNTILLELEVEKASVTTVRSPVKAADVHVADSLAGLTVPQLRSARRIADLGAGGGFPGLALAAALPEARLAVVESVRRKCDFMVRAAGAAGLRNVEVAVARAEEWSEGLANNDVVVARALAPLGVIAEYAAPLLTEGGTLVAYKGKRDPEEEQVAARAAAELGLTASAVMRVTPYPEAGERHLHLYEKTAPTPNRFPRRAGMARKRPLGTTR